MASPPRNVRRGRPPLDEAQIQAARASILAAAQIVYSRTGKDVPVQEILEEAKVSRATFYKFFPSKEELHVALLGFGVDLMLASVASAVQQEKEPLDRVVAAIDAFFSFHPTQQGLFRILLAASLAPGTPIYELRRASMRRFASLFAAEVERAGREPVEPFIHRALVAAIEGISIHLLQGEGPIDAGELARAKAALVRLVAATLAEEDDPVPALPRG